MVRGLKLLEVSPLHVIHEVAAVLALVQTTDTKPGWVAMKRARSAISCSTSAWLFGGTLTVVIWVTISLVSRISGMGVLPGCARDNAHARMRFPRYTRSISCLRASIACAIATVRRAMS